MLLLIVSARRESDVSNKVWGDIPINKTYGKHSGETEETEVPVTSLFQGLSHQF